MKRKSIRKFEYLEDSLRHTLSVEDINEECRGWAMYNSKGEIMQGYKKVLAFSYIIPLIIILWIIEFPILLIINFFIVFDALVSGIPIELVPIIAPAKTIDYIDNKIKIEIRHNEHAPPHFHVIIDNDNCSFNILNGEHLQGDFTNKKHYKKVNKWYKKNKSILVKVWNETRPTDCPVGPISL